MIILGIDPGIANTGYGVVKASANRVEPLHFGNIRTSPKTAPEKRLQQIYDSITEVITEFNIDILF